MTGKVRNIDPLEAGTSRAPTRSRLWSERRIGWHRAAATSNRPLTERLLERIWLP
jgi:hypothetical protein